MSRSIAITGAGGGIGGVLVDMSRSRGDSVRGLYRTDDERAEAARRAGVRVIIGDLADRDALRELLDGGVDVLLHTAAAVTRDLARAEEANVAGTRTVAEAAIAAGVRRFVHFSSVAVHLGHADRHGRFPESLEPVESRRMDVYSRTKWRAELALREVTAGAALQTTVLRPTCVYGPGIDSWTLTPLAMLARGLPLQFTRGPGCIDVIYVDDLARTALRIADCPEAAGGTYNVGGGLVRTADFLGGLAAMIGRRARRISRFGAGLIIGAAGLVGRVVRLSPEAEPNRLRLLRLCTTARPGSDPFPSAAITKLVGPPGETSLAAGLLRTHTWLLAAGHLEAARREPIRAASSAFAFTPRAVLRAGDDEDVRHAVGFALREGRTLRTLGALHSFAPLPATDDLALVLDHREAPITIDGDLVNVPGGVTLERLNAQLAEHRLALPILGGIAAQTVAGAIASGTHGSSLRHGSLLEAVEAVRLVTAESGDAPIREFRRGDDDFPGAALSLGVCGVTTRVTLRAVPEFGLRSNVSRSSFAEFEADWERRIAEHEFVEFFWHPLIDVVETIVSERTDSAEGIPANRDIRSVPPLSRFRMLRPLVRRVLRLMHGGHRRWLHRRVVRRGVGRWYPDREGRSDFVLAYHRAVDTGIELADVEVAVPLARAVEALRALRDHFLRVDRYPVLGVRIRVQRAEPFWLSGAHDRDVCWIEVYSSPSDRFLRELDEVWTPFDYRRHWGKTAVGDPRSVAARLPELSRFLDLRRRCDPGGVFLNDHVAARLMIEPAG